MIATLAVTFAVCMLLLAYTQHLQRQVNDNLIAALKDVVEILKKHNRLLQDKED